VASGWQNGWIVFADPTSAQKGPAAADGWAAVLRYQAPFSGSTPDTLVDSTSGTVAVTYNREGLAVATGSSGGVGLGNDLNSNNNDIYLSLHDPTASPIYTRCLQISAVGALQVTQPASNATPSSNANCT
jgi:hypothetical protein